MRRTGKSRSGGEVRRTVYPSAASVKELWSGPIERLAWGGRGVARAEDGRLILLEAPLAIFPGEVVEAEIRWKPRHAEGQVLRWLTRNAGREEAACPVADRCGGCDLQGAGTGAGALKRSMVEDLVRRQLPQAPPFRWLEAPPEARRGRIQVHWDGTDLGFHRRGSHQVVPVRSCPAAQPTLSGALPRLKEALEAKALPSRPARWELSTGTPEGDVRASLEDGRAWRLEPDGWHRCTEPMSHALPCGTLQHQAGGFFQTAPAWAAEAFSQALAPWSLSGDTLFDLFGGVGLFSALLGERFRYRVLVEFDPTAVGWAEKNLRSAGLPGECHAGDVAAWMPEGLGTDTDLILLDPPRAGLAPELAERLLSAQAGALILVGCDGAAFCRDLQRLSPTWELQDLAFMDLFPLTTHVEGIALLKRRGAR